jgi:hypothetical protein
MFIKNKRHLNPAHIFPKKEKEPKTRTTIRMVLMSQFDNDEERQTLLKRQKKQEESTMRGSVLNK